MKTRRDFLKSGGILMVGFPLADQINPAFTEGLRKTTKTVALDEVDAFLAITEDQNVTVYSGKVDLGTGVRTAMAQIAAEELDVELARITSGLDFPKKTACGTMCLPRKWARNR
jgi:nicotinate dehydrogenase subunit B